MKKITIAIALCASALAATALDLSAYGFAMTGEKTVGQTQFSVLSDSGGGTVLLDAQAEPTPERAQALRTLVAEVRSWKGITAGDIQAVNSADRLALTIMPTSFEVDGISLAGAVPGGIQLFFDSGAEYGLKVRSGSYLVRVDGVYTDESQLESAALSAFKDPASFVAIRDPAYLRKILEGDIASMKADILALKAQNDRLKGALLLSLNGGKAVRPEIEAKIVELKSANPSIDKVGIAAGLKTAGLKPTPSEVSAVLLVEYGQ